MFSSQVGTQTVKMQFDTGRRKTKGSIRARIVKAQIFLFVQVRSIIDYIFSPCNPL